jgi:hypothetical protein
VGAAVSNTAMFAAVLVLGEAVRSRRALALEQERSERLLLPSARDQRNHALTALQSKQHRRQRPRRYLEVVSLP